MRAFAGSDLLVASRVDISMQSHFDASTSRFWKPLTVRQGPCESHAIAGGSSYLRECSRCFDLLSTGGSSRDCFRGPLIPFI